MFLGATHLVSLQSDYNNEYRKTFLVMIQSYQGDEILKALMPHLIDGCKPVDLFISYLRPPKPSQIRAMNDGTKNLEKEFYLTEMPSMETIARIIDRGRQLYYSRTMREQKILSKLRDSYTRKKLMDAAMKYVPYHKFVGKIWNEDSQSYRINLELESGEKIAVSTERYDELLRAGRIVFPQIMAPGNV